MCFQKNDILRHININFRIVRHNKKKGEQKGRNEV